MVDTAYVGALNDSSEKVVQIACLVMGQRGGDEGLAALRNLLGHPSWRVRLEACKAFITRHPAGTEVLATLEAMSREPEAAVYDAECERD